MSLRRFALFDKGNIESDGGLPLLHGTVAKQIKDAETARLLARAPCCWRRANAR